MTCALNSRKINMSNEEFIPYTLVLPVLDTSLLERLNYYINVHMFRERRKHKKNNNSKSLYNCFKLIFITNTECGMSYVQGYKIRPWSAEGKDTDSACSRTPLETPGPSADHGLTIPKDLHFVNLTFLQRACFLITGLEHSKSDLVFKYPKLGDNYIFRMLSW